MLECLSDYTALIQLLVGSIFISNIFFSRRDPYESERKDLCDSFQRIFQGEDIQGYKPVASLTWKKEFKILLTSLMVVLSIYGCIILFHCASHVSIFGILVLSTIVSIYQIYVFIKYGKHNYNSVFYKICVFLIIIFFFFFITYNDLLTQELDFEISNINIKTIANSWVLINFIIWFSLYSKSYYIYRASKYVTYRLFINVNYCSQVTLASRLEYTFNILQKKDLNIGIFIKKQLLIKLIKDLRKEEFYYSVQPENNPILIDRKLKTKLLGIIKNSQSSLFTKVLLKLSVKKNLKIKMDDSISVNVFNKVQKERSDVLKRGLVRLEHLGILRKETDE